MQSALKSGTKLGPYEILAQIDAGGMGEVYEARDTKLGRNVAIKVFPSAFVHDPEPLARFQREARMLALLNHPNIATIHELEQSARTHYLEMELVPGETLAERMSKGALPLEQALKIAGQDRRSVRGCAPEGSDPPGPEASKCEGDTGRAGEGAGFCFGESICRRR